MHKPLPRSLMVVAVVVLLVCSAAVAGSLCHQASMAGKISHVQANLEAVQARLRKQQVEYAQYQAELPLIQAQLAEIQPVADTAYEQEQAMRQQRKELRAENATLAEELAALQAEAEGASDEGLQTAAAIVRLQNALDLLRELGILFE